MLHHFLVQNQSEILSLTERKTQDLAGSLKSSESLKNGLPVFLDNLIGFLKEPSGELKEKRIVAGAALHGRELLRLNYSLSHVVHAYGAICQAITELAVKRDAQISTQDFNDLNRCLDIAIASAVSEFQYQSVHNNEVRELQHMGFLVHELRNALSSASVAQEMIKQGLVGTGGSTAIVLEESLARMRDLIDRSLTELRMRVNPEVHIEDFNLNVLIDQIILTANSGALSKNITLKNSINSTIEMTTDRQLLLPCLANIIQNGIKYSKANGQVSILAGISGENVVIEVQDQCGGLSKSVRENLFKPFTKGPDDSSGLGLGLTISKRAIELLKGSISVHDNPRIGCAFIIELPRKISGGPSVKKSVSGDDSVQPAVTRPK